MDRLDYVSMLSNELCYVEALEQYVVLWSATLPTSIQTMSITMVHGVARGCNDTTEHYISLAMVQ